jgi:hypothetical protein
MRTGDHERLMNIEVKRVPRDLARLTHNLERMNRERACLLF